MFQLISDVLKYAFVIVVYMFIFSVIKLIYLDISDTKRLSKSLDDAYAYLKLINLRKDLKFKVYESYGIRDEVTIGRNRKSDIYINDPFMSKDHARIYLEEGHYYLEDLKSTNGTLLNGKEIKGKTIKLNENDKITFGQVSFLFINTI